MPGGEVIRRVKWAAWCVASDAYVGLLWLALAYGAVLYAMDWLGRGWQF